MIPLREGIERPVFTIEVSPDGQTIASLGLNGDLRLWRISEKVSVKPHQLTNRSFVA